MKKKVLFKYFWWKFVYFLFLVFILFISIALVYFGFVRKEFALFVGLIPLSVIGTIFLLSRKEAFGNLDQQKQLELESYDDYIVVPKGEYNKLLKEVQTDYIVYDAYEGYYIMTRDKKLLFQILNWRIYTPYKQKVGRIRSCIFFPACYVKIKGMFSFFVCRNLKLSLEDSKFYIWSKGLVYDKKKRFVVSIKNPYDVYAEISTRAHDCYFKMNQDKYYLESILIKIAGERIDRAIEYNYQKRYF